jgi:spermidine/putrescine transport system ATP-binding protein
MSDRVAVMNRGVVEQVATSDEIYNRPATPFVAGFVGEQNVFSGRVTAADGGKVEVETRLGTFRGIDRQGLSVGEEALAMVRPERVWIGSRADDSAPANGAAHNRLVAQLQRRDLEGPLINLHLDAGGQAIQVNLHNTGDAGLGAENEQTLFFSAEDTLVMRPAAARG